jgi:uncharacterized membrane protein YhaH (DUF805 family)
MDLFRFSGRIGRLGYLFAGSMLGLCIFSMLLLKKFLFLESTLFDMAVFLPVVGLCLLSGYTFTVRRLHDINLSGWWAFGLFICKSIITIGYVKLAYGMWSVYTNMLSLADIPVNDKIYVIGSLILKCLLVIFLISMPGTKGKNRFGEDPAKVDEMEPTT